MNNQKPDYDDLAWGNEKQNRVSAFTHKKKKARPEEPRLKNSGSKHKQRVPVLTDLDDYLDLDLD